MTVDESTYGEDDGNTTDDDHPVAWCTDFDGGRAWYTAMGHTQASFSEADVPRPHLLGGLRTAAGAVTADCGAPRQAPPAASDFEVRAIDDDTESPMELAVAKDGRVFYVERITGEVNVIKPDGTVADRRRDPGLERAGERAHGHRPGPELRRQPQLLRRLHAAAGLLDGDPRRALHAQRRHAGPGLAEGHLPDATTSARSAATRPARWPSAWTAASTCRPATTRTRSPRTASTRSTSAPGREFWDAQRTSANTNSYSGKILRIVPLANPTAPGVGTGYTIPTGNLFNEAEDTQNKTLPEIFAMGFRNPFRITVDPNSGKVLMGDYGPDAGATNPNRGPQGSVEYNVVTPGNYGWPYCVRDNVPYNDYNFATGASGPKFNCAAPVNNSPNNTGLTNLPPAKPAVDVDGLHRDRRRATRASARAAPRPAARATSSTRTSTPTRSSRPSTTSSGSSASGTTAGSRPPR